MTNYILYGYSVTQRYDQMLNKGFALLGKPVVLVPEVLDEHSDTYVQLNVVYPQPTGIESHWLILVYSVVVGVEQSESENRLKIKWVLLYSLIFK